jgi:hypothetical protein
MKILLVSVGRFPEHAELNGALVERFLKGSHNQRLKDIQCKYLLFLEA